MIQRCLILMLLLCSSTAFADDLYPERIRDNAKVAVFPFSVEAESGKLAQMAPKWAAASIREAGYEPMLAEELFEITGGTKSVADLEACKHETACLLRLADEGDADYLITGEIRAIKAGFTASMQIFRVGKEKEIRRRVFTVTGNLETEEKADAPKTDVKSETSQAEEPKVSSDSGEEAPQEEPDKAEKAEKQERADEEEPQELDEKPAQTEADILKIALQRLKSSVIEATASLVLGPQKEAPKAAENNIEQSDAPVLSNEGVGWEAAKWTTLVAGLGLEAAGLTLAILADNMAKDYNDKFHTKHYVDKKLYNDAKSQVKLGNALIATGGVVLGASILCFILDALDVDEKPLDRLGIGPGPGAYSAGMTVAYQY